MAPFARMRTVALDCPDPRALAVFYRGLVGGEITDEDDDWVDLRDGEQVVLSFQRVDDHVAPDWPDGPQKQQLHLDFTVDDIEDASRRVLSLGATRTSVQPGAEENWWVFLDPVGHPFCLCWD